MMRFEPYHAFFLIKGSALLQPSRDVLLWMSESWPRPYHRVNASRPRASSGSEVEARWSNGRIYHKVFPAWRGVSV